MAASHTILCYYATHEYNKAFHQEVTPLGTLLLTFVAEFLVQA